MKPSNVIIGAAFIVFGLIKLGEELDLFYFDWHWIRRMWPIGLIALGIWLLGRKREDPPNNDYNQSGTGYSNPAPPEGPFPEDPRSAEHPAE
ncbi:LiaI-LiaF-like domain-containing protein [Siphonobacter aquaeclarae]|uniref:LiaI-LiaF-like transmembrane region domain-containing protein n=1 Tax=Siphonobacter aquaeclarae TaxID=563176 RepID=A0A1G9UD20_9BACT|nr:DUF5668 domain-containing protein [Siphonobacter aquaeclarae]SDM57826.1 hypothetical protein SAMN04488090_3773 [Siphonobacter aquaeclarae]